MAKYLVLVCGLLLLSISVVACQGGSATGVREVALDELFTNPGKYNGKYVITDGFYFHGFEVNVLAEGLEYSGLAEGHLIPQGRMLWVEGGVSAEVWDRLYQQQMMGPGERYGKVRITGKFEYGGKYGHVGAYGYQMTSSQLELLPWSP